MDLALNDLQRLICYKTNQQTNQPTITTKKTFKFTPNQIAEAKNVIYLLDCTHCQK